MSSVAGLLLLLSCLACSDGQMGSVESSEESLASEDMAGGGARAISAPMPELAPQDGRPAQLPTQAEVPPPEMVIRTGVAELEVDEVAPALDSVRALIARLGGQVADLSVVSGQGQRREARMTARIPAQQFDAALAALRPLGEVRNVSVSAQNVGQEYVDLEARVRNRQRLEQRLLQLLDTRTGKLEEVLAVERELARVREEIERHETRMRYLRSQVALSTLTIVLLEPEPFMTGAQSQNVFGRAIRQAWRNFVGLVVAFIASLGVVIPLALGAGVIWWLLRRRRRRRVE